jgi:hypothetical protein
MDKQPNATDLAALASKWYDSVRGGAFSVGECVATNASIARKLRTALAAVEEAKP